MISFSIRGHEGVVCVLVGGKLCGNIFIVNGGRRARMFVGGGVVDAWWSGCVPCLGDLREWCFGVWCRYGGGGWYKLGGV